MPVHEVLRVRVAVPRRHYALADGPEDLVMLLEEGPAVWSHERAVPVPLDADPVHAEHVLHQGHQLPLALLRVRPLALRRIELVMGLDGVLHGHHCGHKLLVCLLCLRLDLLAISSYAEGSASRASCNLCDRAGPRGLPSAPPPFFPLSRQSAARAISWPREAPAAARAAVNRGCQPAAASSPTATWRPTEPGAGTRAPPPPRRCAW